MTRASVEKHGEWQVWGVMLLVVLVRVAAIGVLRNAEGAYEHAEIAGHLVRGEKFLFSFHGPALPTSHQAPMVPMLLAGCFGLSGEGTLGAYLLAQGMNVVLALMTAWGILRIAEGLWGRGAAVAAVGILAVYPAAVFAVTRVQAVNWSMAFLALGVAAAMRAYASGRWQDGAWAGALLGTGALGEPLLLAPAMGLCAWLVVRKMPRQAAVVGATALLVIMPWTVRNYAVHGRVVGVKSTFWYVFWQGNNPAATGTDKLAVAPETAAALAWRVSTRGLEADLEAARRQAISVDSAMPPEMRARVERAATEMGRMDVFKEAALRELRDHPWHYAAMCGKRAWQMVAFDPTNPRTLVMAYRGPWLVLLGMGAAGLLWRRARGGRGGWVVAVMLGALLLVHVLVITSARFRLPFEVFLMMPAGALVAGIAGQLSGRSKMAGTAS